MVTLMVFNDLPEPPLVGPVRGPFVHHDGRPVGERAVDEVRVPGDPADVGRAEIDVVLLEVEHPLRVVTAVPTR